MRRMTRCTGTITAKFLTVAEVRLIKRTTIKIGNLLADVYGILEGALLFGKLLDEGSRRYDRGADLKIELTSIDVPSKPLFEACTDQSADETEERDSG